MTPIYFFTEDDKEEIVTPEMPLFQSEEGKFLSTKKINPNKLTKPNHGKVQVSIEGFKILTKSPSYIVIYLVKVKSTGRFHQMFATFLENLNCKKDSIIKLPLACFIY